MWCITMSGGRCTMCRGSVRAEGGEKRICLERQRCWGVIAARFEARDDTLQRYGLF